MNGSISKHHLKMSIPDKNLARVFATLHTESYAPFAIHKEAEKYVGATKPVLERLYYDTMQKSHEFPQQMRWVNFANLLKFVYSKTHPIGVISTVHPLESYWSYMCSVIEM